MTVIQTESFPCTRGAMEVSEDKVITCVRVTLCRRVKGLYLQRRVQGLGVWWLPNIR